MRTQLVTLKLGFKVNEQRLKDVVLREPTVADYIAAEVNAPVYRQYAFKVALISRLIEKLEGFDGEVTMGMMKELKPVDVARLSDALDQPTAAVRAYHHETQTKPNTDALVYLHEGGYLKCATAACAAVSRPHPWRGSRLVGSPFGLPKSSRFRARCSPTIGRTSPTTAT